MTAKPAGARLSPSPGRVAPAGPSHAVLAAHAVPYDSCLASLCRSNPSPAPPCHLGCRDHPFDYAGSLLRCCLPARGRG